MAILFKRILISLLLLFLLVIALNFHYFYVNLSFVFSKQPVALGGSFKLAADGQKDFMEPNYLLIPSLGIQAPVVYASENSDKAFSEALRNGVVHYPGTALPGEAGNCFIFGHSSDYPWKSGSYKTIFALLPKISPGEQILVSNPSGTVFRYLVVETQIVSADEVDLLDQDNYQSKILTLQTSYPLGTALKRFIVRAEMR